MKNVCILVFAIGALTALATGSGLSSSEIDLFYNSGSQGGNVSVTSDATTYSITSNGLPDHVWGAANGNTPSAQTFTLTINKNVAVGDKKCLPMGQIGFTKQGVAIFNLLTVDILNAVEGDAAETFDNCDGHATGLGVYHYHRLESNCVYSGSTDEFIGVAIDGIPIYGPNVSWQDSVLTSADLDECNGKTINGEYKYFVTADWPYFLGCLKGEVIDDEYAIVNNFSCEETSAFDHCGYLCVCVAVGDASDVQCGSDSNAAQTIKHSWMIIVMAMGVLLYAFGKV